MSHLWTSKRSTIKAWLCKDNITKTKKLSHSKKCLQGFPNRCSEMRCSCVKQCTESWREVFMKATVSAVFRNDGCYVTIDGWRTQHSSPRRSVSNWVRLQSTPKHFCLWFEGDLKMEIKIEREKEKIRWCEALNEWIWGL